MRVFPAYCDSILSFRWYFSGHLCGCGSKSDPSTSGSLSRRTGAFVTVGDGGVEPKIAVSATDKET
jgi:hypothetical protein